MKREKPTKNNTGFKTYPVRESGSKKTTKVISTGCIISERKTVDDGINLEDAGPYKDRKLSTAPKEVQDYYRNLVGDRVYNARLELEKLLSN